MLSESVYKTQTPRLGFQGTDRNVPDLLPGHGHVLEELEDGVRHELERTEVDALVVAVFAARHVSVVADDFAQMLRRHVLLLHIDEAEFPLLGILLVMQLLPSVQKSCIRRGQFVIPKFSHPRSENSHKV